MQAWSALRLAEDHEAGPLVMMGRYVVVLQHLECDLGRDEGLCALPEVADGSVPHVSGISLHGVVAQ